MELTPVRRELKQWRRVEIKAFLRGDGADLCEEGVTVVESGGE